MKKNFSFIVFALLALMSIVGSCKKSEGVSQSVFCDVWLYAPAEGTANKWLYQGRTWGYVFPGSLDVSQIKTEDHALLSLTSNNELELKDGTKIKALFTNFSPSGSGDCIYHKIPYDSYLFIVALGWTWNSLYGYQYRTIGTEIDAFSFVLKNDIYDLLQDCN